MPDDPQFADWNWEDPDSLGVRLDRFTAEIATCEKIEQVASAPPRGRAEFAELGISGIEFAAFKTGHPAALGTDIVSLEAGETSTRPGPLFRIDGERYFTELDIAGPLPFDDGSVDWVYAEHLLEHVPLPTAVTWLTEVRRILAPGGLVRLTTPDLGKYVAGYTEERGFFAKHRRRLRVMRVGPPMPERRAFMFNQIFYLYGHRWIYDLDEVRYVLTSAGFAADAITEREFQTGARKDVADLDTSFRSDETIYVEATA